MVAFTDSHCHLDFDALSSKLPALLTECNTLNIKRIIIPSIGPENWHQVLKLANQPRANCQLLPCLGIHPWFLAQTNEHSITELDTLLSQHAETIIALGEAGVDGTIALQQDNLAQQISIFEQQLQLANKHQLPIIVHHRRSHPEVYQCLKQAKLEQAGIIHAFSGSYQQAKLYIDLGFKLGIGGTITYERAKKTINAIKRLPLSSLVLETDAPAMPLNGFQGQDNSPLQLIKVFETLVELREEPAEQIAEQIELNIDQLFALKR
ncbi:TatD family hydrolase [Colwellia sp. MEBiC06753]